MSRIVLAMSGGVDSSVAAHLLVEQGHEVIGVFMRHGEEAIEVCATGDRATGDRATGDRATGDRATGDRATGNRAMGDSSLPRLPIANPRSDHKQGCCTANDAADARRVADRLNIPFYALNLQAEFSRIIDYFVDEYTAGRTPNPCVMCNNWIKFGKLFDYAESVGAEFVATGHYAQLATDQTVVGDTAEPRLLRGIDDGKDQSYVLFGIAREFLPRMLLPVGMYRKPRIRELATQLGLRVADKKDSQEICFVTTGKHDEFVRARRGNDEMKGDIVTMDGHIVGQHPGIERFTIGQRKGLGVAMGEPYFVVRIEPESHNVVIGTHDDLARQELTANRANWLVDPPVGPFRCHAQIRYNSAAFPATAECLADDRLTVVFDKPLHGVAPGQAVVCYDGPRVLGGGWIESL